MCIRDRSWGADWTYWDGERSAEVQAEDRLKTGFRNSGSRMTNEKKCLLTKRITHSMLDCVEKFIETFPYSEWWRYIGSMKPRQPRIMRKVPTWASNCRTIRGFDQIINQSAYESGLFYSLKFSNSNLYTNRPSSRKEAEWRTNGKTFIYIGVRNRRTSRQNLWCRIWCGTGCADGAGSLQPCSMWDLHLSLIHI